MLSKQVSQGSSEWFWNTTARSGPGPLISLLAHSSAPLVGGGQAGDQVQQRGLAAARVADERHELALGDGQVDAAQRREQALGGAEGLLDALDFDELGGV
jgi:hypothetical protein